MATKANLVIDQGSSFYIDVILTDENEDPIDITQYQANSQIRKWYSSNNIAASFVVSPVPELGVFNLSLDSSITANIEYGRYVYDIELTHIQENVTNRILEGIITITPEVTK